MKPKPKPKKRWKPKDGEQYYSVYFGDGSIILKSIWHNNDLYPIFGVYKTKREAQALVKKICAFVAREIGD